MKKVLLIAFHYPPIQGSSGYLRTLKFTRYLGEFGCEPTVLTVVPSAYEAINPKGNAQIPAGVSVHRSRAFDLPKRISLGGRYPGFLAVPDRYTPWIPFAVRDGLKLIRERGIDVIFSTYPIPSAHVIGSLLQRFSGKPWVADFRDPMWDDFSEHGTLALRARKAIEAGTAKRASHLVVATHGMEGLYRRRYPGIAQGGITAILNGYDEEDFAALPPSPARRAGDPVTLIHAGLLQRVDRNPSGFFRALQILKDRGRIDAARFKARLIASGHDGDFRAELGTLGLQDLVSLEAPLAYGDALAAMAASDILLLFQGPTCDSQIPAKLYEYLRIGKPILALATAAGETGRLTVASGGGEVVGIDDADAIARRLADWLDALEAGKALPMASRAAAGAYSRRAQAGQLAGILKSL